MLKKYRRKINRKQKNAKKRFPEESFGYKSIQKKSRKTLQELFVQLRLLQIN
jgi:hypothetical protein